MGIFTYFKNIREEKNVLKGKATKDKVFSSRNDYPDLRAAAEAFKHSKAKLFDVNSWSKIPGLTSTFELYDENGRRLSDEKVRAGHFIRIVLPGPSPENWVKVTKVRDHKDVAWFSASPSEDPTDKKDDKVEHFFISEASSTFKVELKGKTIRAFEIGRNEGVNVGEEAGKRDLINAMLAGGGWLGFQRMQWKNLTDYLVNLEEIKEKNHA